MPEAQTSPNRFVLVVDDSEMNRELLVDYLEMLGHDSASVADGEQALDSIRQNKPDAVLLDMDMPVMNGLEVLKHLAGDDELRHIPVIMISGRDDQETIVSAIGEGAIDFLGKPFNPTILNARLTSSFEKKDLQDRERALMASLEKSYADLKAAESSRDALTHMIVHDLGNPLSVIKMNTDLLKMGPAMGMPVTEEALDERLGHISTATSSMGTMIQSMLDVSKIESGQLTPDIVSFDLVTLVKELADQYHVSSHERDIQLAVEGEGELLVSSDKTLLTRMLSNLISNTYKYASGAKHLTIGVHRDSGGVEIVVEDDGEGIPEELHNRIFDKFFQVESKGTGVKAGVGLGLAFCRMASEALGGAIRAEAATPRGTRFIISLPAD